MALLLGQLVYTSFAQSGLKILASAGVSRSIEQAFLQHIAFKYWNSYDPPALGYRAVYLLQLDPERTLFGWFYNEQTDDLGRAHLPYFICYYLAEPLVHFKLDSILNCLRNGPVIFVDWQNRPAFLDNLVITNLHYESARPRVAISPQVRTNCHRALKHKQLLNVLIPHQETSPEQATQRTKAVSWRSQSTIPRQTEPNHLLVQAQPERSSKLPQPRSSRDRIQLLSAWRSRQRLVLCSV